MDRLQLQLADISNVYLVVWVLVLVNKKGGMDRVDAYFALGLAGLGLLSIALTGVHNPFQ